MTVQTNTNVASFNGNGVTQIFPIAFKFNNDTDLVVLLVDDDTGAASTLTLNSDYTVSGEGDEEGGLINVVVAPAAGQRLKVSRIVDILQLLDLRNQGKFFAEVHEDAFDLLTMIAQQHESGIRQSLRVAESDPEPARIPPVALRAGRLLAFDSLGNPTTAAPVPDSSTALRLELADLNGASLVGFTQSGAAASPRTALAKLRETVSVLDFEGARVGTDWHPAFMAAINAVQSAGGGKVRIPAGTYKLNQAIELLPAVAPGWHNIILEGDGPASVLDFTGAAADADGIRVMGYGGRFGLRDFTILGARRHGLHINAGIGRGDPQWVLSFAVSGLRIEDCLGDGCRQVQTYMGDFRDVECWNNKGIGFRLFGFHTSINFNKCWSTQNVYGSNIGPGWKINGLTYSSFNSCGSDGHGSSGWEISNVAGVTWNGCGAEGNGADGFAFTTGSDTEGIPTVARGVKGAILDGCFTINNSKASAGVYACHVSIGTANGVPASVSMRGNTSARENVADKSLVYSGASGTIDVSEDMNSMDGATVTTGVVRVTNRTVQGRVALAAFGSNQSVANAADVTANFTSFTVNTLEATLSGGTIQIPPGVRRVRVSAGVYWEAGGAGTRVISLTRTAAGRPGLPMLKTPGNGIAAQNISSGVIDVLPGDTIGLVLFQDSGAALNALSSNRTYLSVEAVG